jgi:hypothetical protein
MAATAATAAARVRCPLLCTSRSLIYVYPTPRPTDVLYLLNYSPPVFSQTVARSLAEASRLGKRVRALELRGSPDLRCVNLMCEKVRGGCACVGRCMGGCERGRLGPITRTC